MMTRLEAIAQVECSEIEVVEMGYSERAGKSRG